VESSVKRVCFLATRNAHKLQELAALVAGSVVWRGVDGFVGLPEAEEAAPTFQGNAEIKARNVARWLAHHPEAWASAFTPGVDATRVWVIADDSGLEVDVLGGAPGVHSARFASLEEGGKGNSRDSDNNAKLLRLLRDVDPRDRAARFRCVLVVLPVVKTPAGGWKIPEPPRTFHGACEGFILDQAAGAGGFGYDPLFRPAGYHLTFAELGESTKNQISHRAQAAAQFRAWLDRGGT